LKTRAQKSNKKKTPNVEQWRKRKKLVCGKQKEGRVLETGEPKKGREPVITF